jgi:hypothetical protein
MSESTEQHSALYNVFHLLKSRPDIKRGTVCLPTQKLEYQLNGKRPNNKGILKLRHFDQKTQIGMKAGEVGSG